MALVSAGAGAVGNRTYGVGSDRDFFPTPWGAFEARYKRVELPYKLSGSGDPFRREVGAGSPSNKDRGRDWEISPTL